MRTFSLSYLPICFLEIVIAVLEVVSSVWTGYLIDFIADTEGSTTHVSILSSVTNNANKRAWFSGGWW